MERCTSRVWTSMGGEGGRIWLAYMVRICNRFLLLIFIRVLSFVFDGTVRRWSWTFICLFLHNLIGGGWLDQG